MMLHNAIVGLGLAMVSMQRLDVSPATDFLLGGAAKRGAGKRCVGSTGTRTRVGFSPGTRAGAPSPGKLFSGGLFCGGELQWCPRGGAEADPGQCWDWGCNWSRYSVEAF